MKFDGYRILARLQDGRARLSAATARTGPPIPGRGARPSKRLPARTRAPRRRGRGRAARRHHQLPGPAERAGRPATRASSPTSCSTSSTSRATTSRGAPLEERKTLLEACSGRPPRARRCATAITWRAPARSSSRQACRLGSKASSPSAATPPTSPARSRTWLKVKCLKRQEFVIGGYTEPEGSRVGLGALLLGVHDAHGQLASRARWAPDSRRRSSTTSSRSGRAAEQQTSPFAQAKIPGITRAHWVRAGARGGGRVHGVDDGRPAAPPVVPGPARGQGAGGGRARAAGRGGGGGEATGTRPITGRREARRAGAARRRAGEETRSRASG